MGLGGEDFVDVMNNVAAAQSASMSGKVVNATESSVRKRRSIIIDEESLLDKFSADHMDAKGNVERNSKYLMDKSVQNKSESKFEDVQEWGLQDDDNAFNRLLKKIVQLPRNLSNHRNIYNNAEEKMPIHRSGYLHSMHASDVYNISRSHSKNDKIKTLYRSKLRANSFFTEDNKHEARIKPQKSSRKGKIRVKRGSKYMIAS